MWQGSIFVTVKISPYDICKCHQHFDTFLRIRAIMCHRNVCACERDGNCRGKLQTQKCHDGLIVAVRSIKGLWSEKTHYRDIKEVWDVLVNQREAHWDADECVLCVRGLDLLALCENSWEKLLSFGVKVTSEGTLMYLRWPGMIQLDFQSFDIHIHSTW